MLFGYVCVWFVWEEGGMMGAGDLVLIFTLISMLITFYSCAFSTY